MQLNKLALGTYFNYLSDR